MAFICFLPFRRGAFDKIIELFSSKELKIIAIYSKGLAVCPGSSKCISDQITCRFIADAKRNITNGDVNSILIKLEDNELDVVRMDKLYLYDEKVGFFS